MHNNINHIKLDDMRPGEKPIMIVKRHWIILVKLFSYFLLGLLFTTMFYIFGNYAWAHLLVIIFWMIYSIFLYIEWLNHELDLYIITNNRIIGVDQVGFLNRKVSECNLGQVQEVGNQTKGLLANLLNYGTIKIQTAGNATNFVMDMAPLPIEHSRRILNEVDKYRDAQKGENK
ncbi:MAG: PH domain-containing protein [Candidatus Gracilibacteria bacterium]|nr:PH domain-containing protein [Candidatus Gracilibacteria bacterium]MDQ7022606.1 PH domain-containing protein [Candidatus Gracilibacteria bacterium]